MGETSRKNIGNRDIESYYRWDVTTVISSVIVVVVVMIMINVNIIIIIVVNTIEVMVITVIITIVERLSLPLL